MQFPLRSLLASALLVAGGCHSANSNDVGGAADLMNEPRWILDSYTLAGKTHSPAPAKISIAFEKRRCSGSAGVNHYDGTYSATAGGIIKIGAMAMTEMGGDPAAMKLEMDYVTLLGKMTSWSVAGGQLVLTDGTAANQLVFVPEAPVVNLPLEETNWIFTGTERTDGTSVSLEPVAGGAQITLTIGKDGRAAGFAGINRYFGTATRGKDGSITFGPMASTKKGGPPELMRQEGAYLGNLSKTSSFRIDGKRLTLENADGSVRLLFEAE